MKFHVVKTKWSGWKVETLRVLIGPNNLLRHPLEYSCVKHGTGTWDCIVGEFS